MAPVSTLLSLFTLALGASAALHETRSRQHSADLAARRVGAIAPREVAVNASKRAAANKKRTEKKKRCGKHNGGHGSGSGTSSTGSGGSSSSGSGGGNGGGSGIAGAGGAGTVKVSLPTDGFVGEQTGAVMSWFQADSSQDSTNGKSWCGIAYTNDMPLFAPDMKIMSPSLAVWGTDPAQWEADGKKWCGLEAEVTYNGKSEIMYIGDAFDPRWVRTETSIDVLYDAFSRLAGDPNYDKNKVGTGVSWKLTGYRKTEYGFQG